MPARHWLMKSEPETFSIDDLQRVGVEPWTGVRNYQARNLMRDELRVGDAVLFYHSNAEPSGVAGLARVTRTGVVDETQFDPASPYHDPAARRDAPRWVCVEVGFVERFAQVVPLAVLKAEPALAGMPLLQRGSRLSVQPVSPAHFARVVAMARRAGPDAGREAAPAGRRKASPTAGARPPAARARRAARR